MSMSNVDLGPAAQRLADLLTAVKDDELDRPTPCPEYSLGDLISHIGGIALAFTDAAAKKAGGHAEREPGGDGSALGADWRERIPRDVVAMAEAWRPPAAWTGMTRIAGGDAPAETVGLSAADELVVHGWDLARATGQAFSADAAVLEAARSFLSLFASPDAPAGPSVPFGPSRSLPGDAPPLDQVISLAGRDVSWTAS
jgi:uncharacterized protein (TIGR03086 family)